MKGQISVNVPNVIKQHSFVEDLSRLRNSMLEAMNQEMFRFLIGCHGRQKAFTLLHDSLTQPETAMEPLSLTSPLSPMLHLPPFPYHDPTVEKTQN